MGYSDYLASKHDLAKELVNNLLEKFEYVSILGHHIVGEQLYVGNRQSSISETSERDCGFVLKIYNGKIYSEYSFNDLTEENIDKVAQDAINKIKLDETLLHDVMKYNQIDDTPLVKTFYRPIEGDSLTNEEIVEKLTNIKDKCLAIDKRVVDAMAVYGWYNVSKLFISKNRDLCQNFTWINSIVRVVVSENNNTKLNMFAKGYNNPTRALKELEEAVPETVDLALKLLNSTNIEPGVYDIICEPSITGLIAHEAFGHGVEMDMYVKERAKSAEYLGKQVASPLVTMHDGATATLSSASYFFDDDGVLASDTTIIKNGILQTGISDVLSANILGSKPTGNGRRESYKRKTYTRMTNTFFSPGKDKVEDMIKSVEHGYLLCQTDNGMEDPKNWNIQCICAYGREIKNGEFTGKIVAPVCMSGYVLDLLNSISMVSDEWEVIGAGHCGKGYKEWVCVSDGGPYIKARCKLG